MKNEVKVALTILVALIVAFFGYRFMSDIPLFSSTYELHSYFERVDGIIPGSGVFTQGVKIGTVNDIRFETTDSVRVTFSISSGGEVPLGSVAYVRSVGLLEKGIDIERARSSEFLESGSRIDGEYDAGIMGTIENLGTDMAPDIAKSTESLSSLLEQIDQMLTEGGRSDIEQTLSGLNSTISQIDNLLKSKNKEIDETISSLQRTIGNAEGITEDQKERIDSLMINLQSSSEKLETLAEEMNDASQRLNNVLIKIDEGEGSLGLLINDSSLYNNLDSLSYNLNRLVKNINENPRDYLKHLRLIDVF